MSVKEEWEKYWKDSEELESSGTVVGNWLRSYRLNRVREIMSTFPRSVSILDMGCGGGKVLLLFKEMGFKNLTGIDFSESSVERCLNLGFKNVYLMDAKNTSFPNQSFDIIFEEGLWEHFSDPRPYMLEATRLSKQYIVAIQPNHFTLFGKLMNIGWNVFTKDWGGVKEYSFPMSYFCDFLKFYGFELSYSLYSLLHEQDVMLFEHHNGTNFYNIHNLVKIKTNHDFKQLSHFKVERLDENEVDIVIDFSNFKCNLTGYKRVGKYSIGKHSLYCKDKHKFSFWKVWFEGLDQLQTTIHFRGDPFFSSEIFFVLLLEPFLTYKFSKKGVLFLHSSAFSFNDEGVIVSGRTGVGKTTSLLKLLSLPETKYFADDQSIVKDAKLYSYPMPIGLRTHLVRACKLRLHSKDMIHILFHNMINVLTGYYGNLTHRVFPKDIILKDTQSNIKTGKKAEINLTFLINLGDKFEVKKLTSEQALERLLQHNRGNEDKQQIIYRYFTAFKQVYPEFNYWKKFRDLLEEFVNTSVSFYEVQLSKKYKITRNLKKVIEILEKEKCY